PVSAGVLQGDPMGPLLFAIGLQRVLEKLAGRFPMLTQLWYLDDGSIRGSLHKLCEYWLQVAGALQEIGLEVNQGKCALLTTSACIEDRYLKACTSPAEWTILG